MTHTRAQNKKKHAHKRNEPANHGIYNMLFCLNFTHRERGDHDIVGQDVKLLDVVARRVVRARQAVQSRDTFRRRGGG